MGVLQAVSGSRLMFGVPSLFPGGKEPRPGHRAAEVLPSCCWEAPECTWAGSCHHVGTMSGLSCSSSQAVASKLDLPDDLVGYFSLFLVRETKDGAFSCE